MTHWRKCFDSDYIGSWDLDKDTTLEITKVVVGEVRGGKGEKQKRPILYFKDASKGFLANKTNAKTIAGLFGNDTDNWTGKRITLFVTQCEAFNETVDCIRVRNQVPK